MNFMLWSIAVPVLLGVVIKWITSLPAPIKMTMNYGTPGPFYWLKRIYALCFLTLFKLQLRRRLSFFDIGSRDFKKIGVVATQKEWDLELPRPLSNNLSNDVIFVYGTDGKGMTLVASINRFLGRQSEVFFMLVQPNGIQYVLPGHPDTMIYNTDGKTFSAAGLTLEVIEPFRKWRIGFNGQVRKKISSSDSGTLVHLRFNAIWTGICRPFEVNTEFSPQLVAKAAARELWRNRRDSWRQLCKSPWTSFDQWGSMHGTLREEEQPERVVYLRGLRQRRFGDVSSATLRRNLLLIGQSEEGVFFCLRGTCDSWRLSHEVAGHMFHPSGLVLPITRCDLELADIGHFGVLPPRFSLRFTGGHHFSYHLSIHKLPFFDESFKGRPWNRRVQHFLCDISANSNSGWGYVELTNRYNATCPLSIETSLPSYEIQSHQIAQTPLGVLLTDERAKNVECAGGKGSSLAILSSIERNSSSDQFTVPKGFVLTTKSFEKQLADDKNVLSAIKSLENAVRAIGGGDIKEETEKAAAAIIASPVCLDVNSTVDRCLEELFPEGFDHVAFAVRSSGVTEDSDVLSAAGQNETFLNCKGKDSILDAVAKCWASAYKLPSVQYRRQHGQTVRTSIAVVVQEMVNPEVSGVLFTCDPVSGNPAKIYITANYGLGESVVSGKSEPDTIIVGRDYNSELRLLNNEIGGKLTKVILKEGGDTEEVEVSSDEQARCCMDEEMSLKLARVGVTTELFFGMPRDNEFCIREGRIYLLQSRPVTHVRSWTDFELTHELDSAVVSDFEMFTKANTGEVLTGATTPLTISTVAKSLDLAIQDCFVERNSGFVIQPQVTRFVSITHHHAMLNVIDTMLANNEAEISATNRAVDMAVYGHIVTTKEMLARGIQRYGVMSQLRKIKSMLVIGYDFLVNSRRVKWAEDQLKGISINHDTCEDPVELFRRICNSLPALVSVCKYHTQTSEFGTTLQLILFLVLSENKTDWTSDILGSLAQLLSACTMVESGEVPESIQKIADAVANSQDSEEFKSMPIDVAVLWLQTDPNKSGQLFREFLKKHGHRCIREFDVVKNTWGMDPRPVVSTIQTIVASSKSGKEIGEVNKKSDIAEETKKLLDTMKPNIKRALSFLLPVARNGVKTREATKSLLIKIVHKFRLAFRKLAKLLVWNGTLINEDLLFYFTFSELDRYINTGDPALLLKAVKRQKLHPQWDGLVFPETSNGLPIPEKEEDTRNIVSVASLRATPVCNGRVKGTARVIVDVAEAVNIQKGEILITRSTDIGWSPYFPLLGGVVTELGGLISHGAVVAREYGLPCIVGAARATSLFATGDHVILDGALGTLEKIQEVN